MVKSVSGDAPIPAAHLPAGSPIDSKEEATGKNAIKGSSVDKVSEGHSQQNSMSVKTADPDTLTPSTGNDLPPAIAAPETASIPSPVHLDAAALESTTQQIRSSLITSLDLLHTQQPDQVTPELAQKVAHLDVELSAITEAPADKLQSLLSTSGKLVDHAVAGTLSIGKLEEIVSELQTKLEDNSIKRSQDEIKSRMEEIETRSQSNLQLIKKLKSAMKYGPFFGIAQVAYIIKDANPGMSLKQAWMKTVTAMSREPNFGVYGFWMFKGSHQQKVNAFIGALGYDPATGSKLNDEEKQAYAKGWRAGDYQSIQRYRQSTAIAQGALTREENREALLKIQQAQERGEELEEALDSIGAENADSADSNNLQTLEDLQFMQDISDIPRQAAEAHKDSLQQQQLIARGKSV